MDNQALYGDFSNYGTTAGYSQDPRPSNPNSDTYAQDTRAWLYRDQWGDYQNRFMPYEDKLIDAVTGSQMLDERLSAIKINTKESFDAAQLSNQQVQARYGMAQTDAQKSTQDRNMAIAQSKVHANSANQTRRHIDDRNLAVMGGGNMRQAIGG